MAKEKGTRIKRGDIECPIRECQEDWEETYQAVRWVLDERDKSIILTRSILVRDEQGGCLCNLKLTPSVIWSLMKMMIELDGRNKRDLVFSNGKRYSLRISGEQIIIGIDMLTSVEYTMFAEISAGDIWFVPVAYMTMAIDHWESYFDSKNILKGVIDAKHIGGFK